MRDCDKFCLRSDRVENFLRVQSSRLVHIDPFQNNSLALAQEMPGHNIGVVLHDRENDLVPDTQPRHRPAIGHHVDTFGRAGIHNDLVFRTGIQELRDRPADTFIFFRRQIRQIMQASVNVGIFL